MRGVHRRALLAAALVVAIGVVAGGVWARYGGGRASAEPAGWPPPASTIALGRSVYAANCAACHGARGEGEPNWKTQRADGTYPAPPHDASGHTWHHSDGLLYRLVREGGAIFGSPTFRSGMPAWGDRLSGEEIRAVIIYLKTLWGPAERRNQAEVSAADPFPPPPAR